MCSSDLHKAGKDGLQETYHHTVDPRIELDLGQIWKIVFGNRTTGERTLNVKLGSVENEQGASGCALEEQALRAYWRVRPEERDDRAGLCNVNKDGIFDIEDL